MRRPKLHPKAALSLRDIVAHLERESPRAEIGL
jgi:hypothetical protein